MPRGQSLGLPREILQVSTVARRMAQTFAQETDRNNASKKTDLDFSRGGSNWRERVEMAGTLRHGSG